jgi:hypothetical protein
MTITKKEKTHSPTDRHTQTQNKTQRNTCASKHTTFLFRLRSKSITIPFSHFRCFSDSQTIRRPRQYPPKQPTSKVPTTTTTTTTKVPATATTTVQGTLVIAFVSSPTGFYDASRSVPICFSIQSLVCVRLVPWTISWLIDERPVWATKSAHWESPGRQWWQRNVLARIRSRRVRRYRGR